MPVYMFQESYTNDAWAVQIKDPQNRMDVARKIIEAQGGKLLSAYYAFGDYDVILIAEFPDNVSAAAIALSVAAGGAPKTFKTTVLLSVDEVLEAMRRAGRAAYRPPGG
jgi:uncharacterized protein with GYD domain